MSGHKTGTREKRLAARPELLEAEKELTRRGDELTRRRQELPWVRVDKDYYFETDEGTASLADLFRDARSCSPTTSCSGPTTAPGARPARRSLTASTASRSTSPAATSCSAPWTFPWASSYGSDFSFDLQAASTPEQQQSGTGEYNFRPMDMRPSLKAGQHGPLAEWAASGACTSGWTGHHEDETRRAPPTPPVTGTAATTSTTASKPGCGRRVAGVTSRVFSAGRGGQRGPGRAVPALRCCLAVRLSHGNAVDRASARHVRHAAGLPA